MEITLEFISTVTSLPLGLPWRKDEKPMGQVAKKTFFQANEHPVEDKNGIIRTSIPYPWMKPVTRLSNIFLLNGGISLFMATISDFSMS